ncbi:hypothetical protein EK0264_05010 [Epidermidibacterium keratini]|uniref:FAD-dependent urate hydroxylase HpyO/Asp monooxygenase CreE-like FAD/NAD(P)-binding domain-containing protein n=2 Tax=Epidermidibacterium keratini TaxID=1891644 RepID=A0A7L4YTA2_9ACTN|nr:hypothetical protein EK0264_05010 [Epidermidibacterium keratini]
MAASFDELVASGTPVEIQLIDPYPIGAGRIWRDDQSPLLWMNSVARDVTVFTDESVQCEGPIRPGPSLADWLSSEGVDALRAAGLSHHIGAFGPDDFVPREVQSVYLQWAFRRALATLPANVSVWEHRQQAIAVYDEPDGQQSVELIDGHMVRADVTVLAQGYLDRHLDAQQQRLASDAAAAGLRYIPAGYTADLDFSAIRPGEDVVVRGFGLAFIDLMALLCEGRGGRFIEQTDGTLRYDPSGLEPVLHVGSRRGVPYHAKLGYDISAAVPRPPQYLSTAAIDAMPAHIDFERDLRPLITTELAAAHYERLATAHPERIHATWPEIRAVLNLGGADTEAFADYIYSVVPDEGDRFELGQIDRPLRGLHFESAEDVDAAVAHYVDADLRRRADPNYSADRAVFDALLGVYGVLAYAVTTGRLSGIDRITRVEGSFHSLFSFLASGPPPRRLRELLALHRAGLVRFGGPDWQVHIADNQFIAQSAAVDASATKAKVLIDAWLPRPDVAATTDPLIRGLLLAGELAVEDLGGDLPGGQLLADAQSRAIRADRSVHPRRFLLGPSVSGSAGSSGFARPHFNAPGLRQNDRVARQILAVLGSRVTEDALASERV